MKQLSLFHPDIEVRHYRALRKRVKRAFAKIADVVDLNAPREKAYLRALRKIGIRRLLIAEPEYLRRIVRCFDRIIPKGDFTNPNNNADYHERFAEITRCVRNAFNYEYFCNTSDKNGKWGGWALAKEINKSLKYCPYCNAETLYAFEWKKNATTLKMAKSAFDHYFPRSRYPFLGLSLYNLIPSCTRCNTAFKGAVSDGLTEMAHPYIDDMDAKMRFHALITNPALAFQGDEHGLAGVVFAEHHYGAFKPGTLWNKMFKVSESYSALYMKDAALALARAKRFPKTYVEMVSQQLKEQGLPVGDLEKQLYGTVIDHDQINLHRHGKLICDLVEEFR